MRIRCVSSPYKITTVYGYVDGYPLNNGFHTGVDYISDGRILSPMDSVVSAIGSDSKNGNYLVLESNGYRDWFSHIKDGGYRVSVGQTVAAGQHIAFQGATGAATGVHVHHSLRINGEMVDPEDHLTKEGDMKTEEILRSALNKAHADKAVFESALNEARRLDHIHESALNAALAENKALRAQLAVQSEDTELLNGFGLWLTKLIARLGLKK